MNGAPAKPISGTGDSRADQPDRLEQRRDGLLGLEGAQRDHVGHGPDRVLR